MKHLCNAFLFCLALAVPSLALADTPPSPAPLFPVALKHAFPGAREAFEEVKRLILENYYSDRITEEALYWAAIQGMLRHISPPENENLARIWAPDEYRTVLDDLQGEQVSLGIKGSFNAGDGSLVVNEVAAGSPAEAVLEPHDRILRIDAAPLGGKTVAQLNALLDGEEGTRVALTVNRDLEIFDVTIERRKFETGQFLVHRLPDSMALIEIRSFPAGLSDRLRSELTRLKAAGCRRLIIDLRNNQGGVFVEPLKIIEFFLPEPQVILKKFQRETQNQQYISTNRDPFAFRMAILVNGKTASAAEVLAGSLRDQQRALLIGTKTYGKGVLERTFTLQNDFKVKFITGVMSTPRGDAWQGKGLLPDFLLDQDERTLDALLRLDVDDRLRKDVGLITAVKLLRLQDAEPLP